MDHVLNAIESHYNAYLREFMEEWRTGGYKKFSDCPSYGEVKAIIDAMNCLRKYLGWGNITLREEVEMYGG